MFGTIEGTPCVFMQGHFHLYEGYSLCQVSHSPVPVSSVKHYFSVVVVIPVILVLCSNLFPILRGEPAEEVQHQMSSLLDFLWRRIHEADKNTLEN